MTGAEYGGRERVQSDREPAGGDPRLPVAHDIPFGLRAPSEVEPVVRRLHTTGTQKEIALASAELAYGLIYDLRLPEAASLLENTLATQPRDIVPGAPTLSLSRVWLEVLRTHYALVIGSDYSGDGQQMPARILSQIVGADFRSEKAFEHPLLRGGEYEQGAHSVASALTRYHAYFWRLLACESVDESKLVFQHAAEAQRNAPSHLEGGLLAATCSDFSRRLGQLDEAQRYAELAVNEVQTSQFGRMSPEVLIRRFGALLASGDIDNAELVVDRMDSIAAENQMDLYQLEARLFRVMILEARGDAREAVKLLSHVESDTQACSFGHLEWPHLIPAIRERLTAQGVKWP